MRLCLRLVRVALALALVAAVPAIAAAAEPADAGATDKPDAAAAVDRCRPTDIIFLIDNSASFTGARAQVKAYAEGAREFLETLGEQHRISMIKFGVDADVMVEPIFNTPENREALVRAIEALRMNEPWTNVYAGVDLAFRKIRVDEDRRGVILMISDGVISMPGPNGRESDDVTSQQKQWIASRLPDAKAINASFFTVAYENKFTDYDLMQKIADGTGGFSAKGDNASLSDTMHKVAVEMCKRDPIPVAAAVVPATPVTPTPVTPPPPTPPVTLTPVPPPPVAPPLGLILGLAGAGVAVLGTGTFLAMRSRRRRRRRREEAESEELDGAFSAGEVAVAGAAVAAGVATAGATRGAARARRDRGKGAADEKFFTRSETVTMEAVPEPPQRKRPPARSSQSGSTQSPRPDSGPSPGRSGPSPGRSAPGSAAPPSVAIDRGGAPARRGPPPKPPGWGEKHMMRIIGFTTGGKEIKEVDFRRSGDVVVAVGTSGGAVISVPPEKGNVRGTVVYNVMPDGTRIVRIKEIPPGGFRDRDTGVALRQGDVLSNNQKIEWVKEDRGRYFEVFYK